MENVFDYRNEIIKLNPGIDKSYATELAYKDHKNYIKLRESGYGKNHSKLLSGAIRNELY
tara:strand:- start:336 stop:515 length:180 start_codon:yes stop_codon:yes gene_type:complete